MKLSRRFLWRRNRRTNFYKRNGVQRVMRMLRFADEVRHKRRLGEGAKYGTVQECWYTLSFSAQLVALCRCPVGLVSCNGVYWPVAEN